MDYIIATFLIATVIYLIDKYFHNYWSRRSIFQLDQSFLFGNWRALVASGKNMGEYWAILYEKFKNKKFFGVQMFYQPILIVTDPELIQDVLIKNFTSFHDRPMPIEAIEKYPLAGHLFNVRGQKWRDLRVKLSPTFTSGKLKVMFPIINDCADVLQKYVEKNVASGNDIMDIKDLFARLTTNIISSVAFGIENDSINDRENIFRKMGLKLFENTPRNVFAQLIGFLAPRLFELSGIDPFGKEITEFMYSMVRQTVEYREKNNVERNDFMQLLIKLKNQGYIPVDKGDKEEISKENSNFDEKKISKLNMDDLTANVFVFFIAGFETSSSTASFCLFELCRNPETQRKAQEEIDRVLKAHGGKLTYDGLAEMKYLDACIDETLRKHPIASFLIRLSTADYKIPNTDITLEKGTSIFIPILGIQRDPNIYEDPLAFKPERFLNSPNGNGKGKGIFYMPFGDGPRNCIGSRIGKLQTKIALVVLLQKFNFEYENKALEREEIEYHQTQFVLSPKETIMLRVSKR